MINKDNVWIPLIFVILSIVNMGSQVLAVQPKGSFDMYYHAYQLSIDPIYIELFGQQLSTGVLTFTPDATKPKPVHKFNFDNMTEEVQLDLQVTAQYPPLNQQPQRIQVNITGTIAIIAPNDLVPEMFQTVIIESTCQSNGVFNTGQFLQGWGFSFTGTSTKTLDIKVDPNGRVTEIQETHQNNTQVDNATGILYSPIGDQSITLTGTGVGMLNPNPHFAPILTAVGNKTIDEGKLLQFTIAATDPDGHDLSYAASNVPSGATFDPNTQIFT